MNTFELVEIIFGTIILVTLIILYKSYFTVSQGTVAVITAWGKYKRMALPGFGFKNPISEQIFKRVSTQNKAMEIEFTAITQDQANVDFKAMLLYATINDEVETIKKVAFKFIDDSSFMQALIRSVEASIRAFVATKKQNEILRLREEIVNAVKHQLDPSLESWGYHLIDLQINDILFDEAIMRSMAQVVSSENLKSAAQNEGEAVLIKMTKEAEAEKTSAILKAEGMAQVDQIISQAMVLSCKEMKSAGLDYNYMMLSQWMESMKHVAEHGTGNVIFFDGNVESMERTLKQMQAMNTLSVKQN